MSFILSNSSANKFYIRIFEPQQESSLLIEFELPASEIHIAEATPELNYMIEVIEGEYPYNNRMFYEVRCPADITINSFHEVYHIVNGLEKRLKYSAENNYFESNVIYLINLSQYCVNVRIDKPDHKSEKNQFIQIKPSAFVKVMRSEINDFYILQLKSENGKINQTNFIVKPGHEFSIDNSLNIICNVNAQIYYTFKNFGENVTKSDIKCT